VWIGVSRKFSPSQDYVSPGSTLLAELLILGAGPIAMLSPKSRALTYGVSWQSGNSRLLQSTVESIDKISGSSDLSKTTQCWVVRIGQYLTLSKY